LVDLALPVPEPGTGARADVAALVAVDADARAFRLQLDGLHVLVAEDVERADDDARGATGAEAGGHDLLVEVAPLGLGVERRGHVRGPSIGPREDRVGSRSGVRMHRIRDRPDLRRSGSLAAPTCC